jgi:hypothetical protein
MLTIGIAQRQNPTFVTIYDVAGAATAPFDTSAANRGTMENADEDLVNAPDITPSTANGLIILALNMGIGPPIGVTFGTDDMVRYTGRTDGGTESGDGFAHYLNPDTSAEAWTWHISNGGVLSSWSATALAFKAAAAGGSAPSITSLSPTSGAAGTAVTITGTNFAAGATVTFGGRAATGVRVANSTTINATAPAPGSGAVSVTVTNPDAQSGTLPSGFTYTGAAGATGASAAISFVQVAEATPQVPSGTVSVSYPGPQTPGALNIVVVGWNDTTATVQSVQDSAGNTYDLAIGPTSGTGLRQSIYYAPSVVGGNNTVTVTFSQPAIYPDIRILEYSGISALDVAAGASGSGTTSNSGSATTTAANELIFGANMVSTDTRAAGTGFASRTITHIDSDIAEDMIVTVAGTYSATASLGTSGNWIMQMATFKRAP